MVFVDYVLGEGVVYVVEIEYDDVGIVWCVDVVVVIVNEDSCSCC